MGRTLTLVEPALLFSFSWSLHTAFLVSILVRTSNLATILSCQLEGGKIVGIYLVEPGLPSLTWSWVFGVRVSLVAAQFIDPRRLRERYPQKGLYETHLGTSGSLSIQENTCDRREPRRHGEHNHEHQDRYGRWLGEVVVIVQILMLGGGEEERNKEVPISRCHGCL